MDKKNVVRRMLDTLFENNELVSATVDVKSKLTVLHIRFDNEAILDSESEPVTYVKKSKYHMDRDRDRSETYKKSKRDRKQTQFYDSSTELPRSCVPENDTFSAPGHSSGLSPCSVYADADGYNHHAMHSRSSESSHVNADSMLSNTAAQHDDSLLSGGINSSFQLSPPNSQKSSHLPFPSPELHIETVPLPTLVENESQTVDEDFPPDKPDPTRKSTQTPEEYFEWDLTDNLDTLLFRTHLAEVDKPLYSMRCYECHHNISHPTKKRRMAYCSYCRLYFCEHCIKNKESSCFCGDSLQDLFIT